MELLDQLARADLYPALLAQVRAMFAEKDFKISALTSLPPMRMTRIALVIQAEQLPRKYRVNLANRSRNLVFD